MNLPASNIGSPGEQSAVPVYRRLASLKFAICVLIPTGLWFAPLGLAPQTQHGLAIVCFMVLAWITQVVEFAITGLFGCFLFWALGVVRFNVAFSGFASETPWFLFAALLLGRIAGKSGLARRLTYSVMMRVGATY